MLPLEGDLLMFQIFLPTLFTHEMSPFRFERVCIDLYREAESIELVPTSVTWDLGRDARPISVRRSSAALQPILCVSLAGDLDRKVEADIKRLAQTTKTEAIVYCTTQPLSEQACDGLEAKIRHLYPEATTVRIISQTQLVALADRYPDVIQKYYAAELANLQQALTAGAEPDAQPDQIGLRLALLMQTGDDARTLRSELTKRLLLEALSATGPMSPGELAVKVSARLHLPRSLSAEYVGQVLQEPCQSDLVRRRGSHYELTQAGQSFLADIPAEAGARLLEGRQAIHGAIKELSGHSLTNDQYERLWEVLQDGLSSLFYQHGASIVRMVSRVIAGGGADSPPINTGDILESLADKVVPLFTSQDQAEDVRLAIIDMFSEPKHEAFQWLRQICSVYVMMCSLGFESLSSQQVRKVLQDLWLVPDSDVIISLLCAGEPNHEEIKRIVDAWRRLGGRLLVSPPVLARIIQQCPARNQSGNDSGTW
jgi:hypothetical protein